MSENMNGSCRCMHHKMMPFFILLLGLTFLLQALGILPADIVGYIWPILLILIGLQKMFGNKCHCCGGK